MHASNFPLCAECEKAGIVKAMEIVDHIIPLSRGGELLAMDNLQSLCRSHHAEKTAAEKGNHQ